MKLSREQIENQPVTMALTREQVENMTGIELCQLSFDPEYRELLNQRHIRTAWDIRQYLLSIAKN